MDFGYKLETFDEKWASAAYRFTLGHSWCEHLARAATWMASGAVVVAVTGVTALLCLIGGRRQLGWWCAVTVAEAPS